MQESPTADKSLQGSPVLLASADSPEPEVASHEQPKAGRTNFSLQPSSLIEGAPCRRWSRYIPQTTRA